jgi:site-specific DNA-methyltransferase (adenine-specific)
MPRSPLNRTLQLSSEERTRYASELLRIEDLRNGKLDSPCSHPMQSAAQSIDSEPDDGAEEGIDPEAFLGKIICAPLEAAAPLLPAGFADLIVCDPPYNLSKDFNGLKFKQMSEDAYEGYIESWLPEVIRLLAPHGSLYICGDWKCTAALQRALSKHLTIMNRITWRREKGRGAARNWKNSMEDIWFAVRDPKHYTFNLEDVKVRHKVIAPYRKDGLAKDWQEDGEGKFRMTCPSNFWDDTVVPFWSMPENTDHPTQKPESLMERIILASSDKGDVVFDPFLGSGTTAVVAKRLGRRWAAIEINEEYCCLAAKRLTCMSR